MLAQLLIILILLVIVGSLFSGMYFMIKDQSGSKRTVKALTFRIGLSLLLFVLLILAYLAGIIHPHGITSR
jgi:hypothetical protein